MIRVVIVDDQAMVRQGIATLLSFDNSIEVVADVESGQQCLEWLENHTSVDLVIMDIRMPEMSGVEAIQEMRNRKFDLPVLFITTFDEPLSVRQAQESGGKGCLLKDADMDELVSAIKMIHQGGTYFDKRLSVSDVDLDQFTPRELTVLKAIADGMSNQEIAESLNLSKGTIKNYTSSIFAKLDVRDRTQAVLKAKQMGLC